MNWVYFCFERVWVELCLCWLYIRVTERYKHISQARILIVNWIDNLKNDTKKVQLYLNHNSFLSVGVGISMFCSLHEVKDHAIKIPWKVSIFGSFYVPSRPQYVLYWFGGRKGHTLMGYPIFDLLTLPLLLPGQILLLNFLLRHYFPAFFFQFHVFFLNVSLGIQIIHEAGITPEEMQLKGMLLC